MLVFASVWQDGRTSVGPDWKEIRMAKIVNSWNDWDPLKRVIVGRCDNSMIPPEEPATSEKVPVDSEMRGVIVDRPTPLQWNQAIGTPDFRNDSMMT